MTARRKEKDLTTSVEMLILKIVTIRHRYARATSKCRVRSGTAVRGCTWAHISGSNVTLCAHIPGRHSSTGLNSVSNGFLASLSRLGRVSS